MSIKSAPKWIIIIVLCLESYGEEDLEGGTIKSAEYNKAVKENKILLVMFYSDDCKKCLPLIPKLKSKFQEYAVTEPEFNFLVIDAKKDNKPNGCELPCMQLFIDKEGKLFSGEVNVKNVLSWVTKSVKVYEMPRKDDVLLLNRIRFAQAVEGSDYLAVNFYGPKCERCDRLKPVFFTLAKKLKTLNSPIRLARLTSPIIASKFNITDLPAIIFFRKGIPSAYEGKYHIDEMEKWLKTLLMASQIQRQGNIMLLNLKNFYKAVGGYRLLCIVFYVPKCAPCTKFLPQYSTAATKLAKEHSLIQLGKVDLQTSAALADGFKIDTLPAIVLVKNGTISSYEGPLQINDVVNWLKKEASAAPKINSPTSYADSSLTEEAHGSFANRSNSTDAKPIESSPKESDIEKAQVVAKDKDVNNIKSVVNNIVYPKRAENLTKATENDDDDAPEFETIMVTPESDIILSESPKSSSANKMLATEMLFSLEGNLTSPEAGKETDETETDLKPAKNKLRDLLFSKTEQVPSAPVQTALVSEHKGNLDPTIQRELVARTNLEATAADAMRSPELKQTVPIPIQPDNSPFVSEHKGNFDLTVEKEPPARSNLEATTTEAITTLKHTQTVPIPNHQKNPLQNNPTPRIVQ